MIDNIGSSGIDLTELIDRAVASLEDDFLTVETVAEDLKDTRLSIILRLKIMSFGRGQLAANR